MARYIASAFSASSRTSPVEAGTVYPGDLVRASFTVSNPTDSSVADESTLVVSLPAGLGYLAGSVRVNGQAYKMPFEETFGSVPAGRLVLHEDSFRLLTVAVNQGRAAERLRARTGDPVVIGRVMA